MITFLEVNLGAVASRLLKMLAFLCLRARNGKRNVSKQGKKDSFFNTIVWLQGTQKKETVHTDTQVQIKPLFLSFTRRYNLKHNYSVTDLLYG